MRRVRKIRGEGRKNIVCVFAVGSGRRNQALSSSSSPVLLALHISPAPRPSSRSHDGARIWRTRAELVGLSGVDFGCLGSSSDCYVFLFPPRKWFSHRPSPFSIILLRTCTYTSTSSTGSSCLQFQSFRPLPLRMTSSSPSQPSSRPSTFEGHTRLVPHGRSLHPAWSRQQVLLSAGSVMTGINRGPDSAI
jgi:hypothetical protein